MKGASDPSVSSWSSKGLCVVFFGKTLESDQTLWCYLCSIDLRNELRLCFLWNFSYVGFLRAVYSMLTGFVSVILVKNKACLPSVSLPSWWDFAREYFVPAAKVKILPRLCSRNKPLACLIPPVHLRTRNTIFLLSQMTVQQLGLNLKDGKVSSSRVKLLLLWAASRLSFHQAVTSPLLTSQSKQTVMENTGLFACILLMNMITKSYRNLVFADIGVIFCVCQGGPPSWRHWVLSGKCCGMND